MSAVPCLGCAVSHSLLAREYIREASKFYSSGDGKLALDHHLLAMQQLRAAEEHLASIGLSELRDRARSVRKKLESALAYGRSVEPSWAEGIPVEEMVRLLREKPEELCPTCATPVEVEHRLEPPP